MQKNTVCFMILVLVVVSGTMYADLIAHYTFDSDTGGTTADSVGSAYATLGPKVGIVDTTDNAPVKVGGGALVMTRWGGGDVGYGLDGAVTSNDFSWASDARTITFWWKCKTGTIDNNGFLAQWRICYAGNTAQTVFVPGYPEPLSAKNHCV